MLSGIYAIINSHDNKIYIGSSKNIKERLKKHKFLLRRKIHHNYRLQYDYNKYGEDGLEFKIIEECERNLLLIKERHWIIYYNSTNSKKGYNISRVSFRTAKLSIRKNKPAFTFSGKERISSIYLKYSYLVEEWKELFQQGFSYIEIGGKYNVPDKIVLDYLKEYYPDKKYIECEEKSSHNAIL